MSFANSPLQRGVSARLGVSAIENGVPRSEEPKEPKQGRQMRNALPTLMSSHFWGASLQPMLDRLSVRSIRARIDARQALGSALRTETVPA